MSESQERSARLHGQPDRLLHSLAKEEWAREYARGPDSLHRAPLSISKSHACSSDEAVYRHAHAPRFRINRRDPLIRNENQEGRG